MSDHYKAISDIELNTKNRNQTAKEDGYGPLNPKDERGSKPFWEAKAKMWNTTVEAAKQSTCGNCAAFNQSKPIKNRIAGALGPAGGKISDLANLGFCEIWEFKCAADRTCNVWLLGGPIKESKMEISEVSRDLAKKYLEEKRGLWDNIHAKRKRIEAGSGEHMRRPGEKGRPTKADFKASQNEERIDEISQATKNRYIMKASDEQGHANFAKRQTTNPDEKKHFANVERKRRSGLKRAFGEETLEEGPKDAAGKDVFVKKIAKSAGVDYKAAGAIAAAAGRKRLGKDAFQRRVEAGKKAAAAARAKGKKYTGEHN